MARFRIKYRLIQRLKNDESQQAVSFISFPRIIAFVEEWKKRWFSLLGAGCPGVDLPLFIYCSVSVHISYPRILKTLNVSWP